MGPAPVTERFLARAAAAGALVVVATAVLAATGRVTTAERALARGAYDLPTWTTDLWRAVMQAGARGSIVVVALALVALRRREAAIGVAVSATIAWWLASVLKEVVDRPRPTAMALGRPIRELVERPGYPSTHTAIAAALATAIVVGLPLPWAGRAALGLVVLGTAVARLHVSAHWPLDVVGGGALGATVACAVGLVAERRR